MSAWIGMAIVELRVHGVSGTPPELVLDDPHPVRVAGDDAAGFWRHASDAGHRFTEEAYEWGGLTSGSPMRAAWVLLAPFAFANAAFATPPRPTRVTGLLMRLFGISLTATLVGAVYIAAVDLLAWQCGNNDACVDRHGYTKFLGWSWLEAPGHRLAVSLIAPVVVICVLWQLARSTWQAAEDFKAKPRTPAEAPVGNPAAEPAPNPTPRGPSTPLDDPEFWDGRERGEFLRHLHVAVSIATVATLLAYVLVRTTKGGDVVCGVSAAVLGASVLLALPEVQPRVSKWRNRSAAAALVAAWSVLVVVAVSTWTDGPNAPAANSPTPLPGVDRVVTYLFVGQLVVVFLVLVTMRWPAAALSLIALALGAAFSAGVIVQAADFLDPGADAIVLPNGVVWAARASVLLIGGIVLVLLSLGALTLFGRLRAVVHRVRAHQPPRAPTDAERIARAKRLARITDQVPRYTRRAMYLVVPVVLGGAVIVVGHDQGWFDWPRTENSQAWDRLTLVGSRMTALFAIAFVLLARRSYRSRSVRRQVGIAWDIATFWPRRAHPLAPPCYAERAVPELAARIDTLACPVILSAHSQGSVIAAAALLRGGGREPDVVLLTYGSPLHRFYAKYFPTYFDASTTAALAGRLDGRWINLFRDTDPIGGSVAASTVDWNVPPVVVAGKVRAHSDYPLEPFYQDALTQAEYWLSDQLFA
jgi:hypothetical protein